MLPAVAAMVSGDRSKFLNVGFFGLQDTLWDEQGRHYYKYCTIEGAVDFIFGAGQSLYEVIIIINGLNIYTKDIKEKYFDVYNLFIFQECSISVIGATLGPGISGYITAQGRTNQNDSNGFVFKNCQVFGNGTTYLGRPWRGYARVLFYNTSLPSIILPGGWEPWYFSGHV